MLFLRIARPLFGSDVDNVVFQNSFVCFNLKKSPSHHPSGGSPPIEHFWSCLRLHYLIGATRRQSLFMEFACAEFRGAQFNVYTTIPTPILGLV